MFGRIVLLLIFFCSFEQVFSAGTEVSPMSPFRKYLQSTPGNDTLHCVEGMFNTYVKNGRYYWEIPDSLQGRDMMIAAVIAEGNRWKAPSPDRKYGYGGDQIGGPLVVRFEGKADKAGLSLVVPFWRRLPLDTANSLCAVSDNGGGQAEIFSFDYLAKGERSGLIEVTSLFKSPLFSLGPFGHILGLGGYEGEESYIREVRGRAENMIVRCVQSYGEMFDPSSSTRWEVSYSVCLLPEKPFRPRYADNRVNYFKFDFQDLNSSAVRSRQSSLIRRWRLEPREEDVDRYKRGELVVPEKPIVFYIDRTTPEWLVPHFAKAINAWQKVFEKAGFKQAVEARPEPAPEEDPDFSPDDIRYNYLFYRYTPNPNAYGASISDPRTGEMLCARIGVFSSVFQLVQNWYFAQCGMSDPRARKILLSDSLLGELVEFAITHEVGHALGLTHNFIGSEAFTVAQLRDRDFVRENGIGASIMDYIRFNYVAQRKDRMPPAGLVPRIGVQDELAIEWGYRCFPGMTPAEEREYLSDWIGRKITGPQLRFGAEDSNDPRCQAEDLTNERVKANALAMKNIKCLLAKNKLWQPENDMERGILKSRYESLVLQYCFWVEQVAAHIGKRKLLTDSYRESGLLFQPVSRAYQEEAMDFLEKYYFSPPDWLLLPGRMRELGVDAGEMARLHDHVLEVCMGQIEYVAENELFPAADTYTVDEYMARLHKAVSGGQKNGRLSRYQLDMQRRYAAHLKEIAEDSRRKNPLLSVKMRQELRLMAGELDHKARSFSNERDKQALSALGNGILIWLDEN